MNPNAINLWVVGASIGFAVGDIRGAAIGLAISSSLTLVITLFAK